MKDKIEIKTPRLKMSDMLECASLDVPDIREEWLQSAVNYIARIHEEIYAQEYNNFINQRKNKMKFRPEFNKVEEKEKIGVGTNFKAHGTIWIIVENSPADEDTNSITLLNTETFAVTDRYAIVENPNWISEREFSDLFFEVFLHFPLMMNIDFDNTIYEE